MLASIQIIKEILPHNNADVLDICKVLGYSCITKKGQFKVGDLIIFIAPDTVLPENTEWAKEFKAKSSRVRAIKLRSVWSEGLVLPLEILKSYGDFV